MMYMNRNAPRWIPVDDTKIRFNSNGSRGIYYMVKFWAVREVYTYYLMFFFMLGIATSWNIGAIPYLLHVLFLFAMLWYRLQANRMLRAEFRTRGTNYV